MGKSLAGIAQQLKNADEKVQLIYAFNGVGKTRLSREFKELVSEETDYEDEDDAEYKPNHNKIIYYNALTEDLFYWENYPQNDHEPKLKIQENSFTKWMLKEQGYEKDAISIFQEYTYNKITPHFNPDYSEVTFSLRGDDTSKKIKISKGEESNFIWSLFYTFIKKAIDAITEKETDKFNNLEYIYIDDPVTSLDEDYLIRLAINLGELIKKAPERMHFIISTHNTLFYNILYNQLGLKKGFFLKNLEDGTFELTKKKGDSNRTFAYHLHIRNLIEQAIKDKCIQRYHIAFLRNLYEKTASFLGHEKWSSLLSPELEQQGLRLMNHYSHYTLSNLEVPEPPESDKSLVSPLLDNLINKCGYAKHDENNN